MLPDALQDVEREVDVQITQEHNAVTILQREKTHMHTNICYMETLRILHFSVCGLVCVRLYWPNGFFRMKESVGSVSVAWLPFQNLKVLSGVSDGRPSSRQTAARHLTDGSTSVHISTRFTPLGGRVCMRATG